MLTTAQMSIPPRSIIINMKAKTGKVFTIVVAMAVWATMLISGLREMNTDSGLSITGIKDPEGLAEPVIGPVTG